MRGRAGGRAGGRVNTPQGASVTNSELESTASSPSSRPTQSKSLSHKNKKDVLLPLTQPQTGGGGGGGGWFVCLFVFKVRADFFFVIAKHKVSSFERPT